MTTPILSTPDSTARVVPLNDAMSMSRRFPRVAAIAARHFPDAMSLLGAGLFLAIAVFPSVYGTDFRYESKMVDGAVVKVLSFVHLYDR